MNASPQIEPVSTDHRLIGNGLAIDEAKLVRTITKSKKLAVKLRKEGRFPDWLIYLNVKIAHLEAKLIEVRSRANCS